MMRLQNTYAYSDSTSKMMAKIAKLSIAEPGFCDHTVDYETKVIFRR